MKIFIIGQKAFGAAVAGMVDDSPHDLLGACAPSWRDARETGRDPLRALVEDRGHLWLPSDQLEADAVPECDLVVLAHAHVYVSAEVRGRARHGAIGYHPSLLPLHRGRDAIRWAIHMGDPVTGGTVYWVDDGVDAGPIAAQRHVFIRPGDEASDLWRRELFPLGLALLRDVVDQVADGSARRDPQDESLATWEPSWRRPPLCKAVPLTQAP